MGGWGVTALRICVAAKLCAGETVGTSRGTVLRMEAMSHAYLRRKEGVPRGAPIRSLFPTDQLLTLFLAAFNQAAAATGGSGWGSRVVQDAGWPLGITPPIDSRPSWIYSQQPEGSLSIHS